MTSNSESKSLICSTCHKKFWCKARASGKYPPWKESCKMVEECDCEDCHPQNRGDRYCGNISGNNPSNRFSDTLDVENLIDVKPIKCEQCGKMFLCRGRINLFNGITPQPQSDCSDKKHCVCENCNLANRTSSVCVNIPLEINPSRRDTWRNPKR